MQVFNLLELLWKIYLIKVYLKIYRLLISLFFQSKKQNKVKKKPQKQTTTPPPQPTQWKFLKVEEAVLQLTFWKSERIEQRDPDVWSSLKQSNHWITKMIII